MRERIARAVSALAVGTLMGLAALFACERNPGETAAEGGVSEARGAPSPAAAVPTGVAAPAADSARGHAVFLAQNCARCHSVAGVGAARLPLDGVGSRRSAEQLRAWSTGAAVLADSLSPSALRTKQGYQLSAADLDALVAFLSSLKDR